MIFQTSLPTVLVILLHLLGARGYIPAQPSNYSVQETNESILHLQWYTDGSDWENLTQQSVGPEISNDIVQGILVHFTEDDANNQPTTTPWIAFMTCDANSTDSSSEADVFTMAKNLGAGSVILYSLYSETCVVNPDYQNTALDIFTTQALNASLNIEYDFGQFGPSSESHYGYFNSTMLNNAAGVVNSTFELGFPMASGFLFATLLTSDASDPGVFDGGSNTTGASTTSSSSGNTGIAMIILYVITGCVSALFCAVIVSGAIRALRYPERYGPRDADPTLGGGRSRAGGLGRAILDTFPIVKFRSSGEDQESSLPGHKDVESGPMASDASVPLPDSVRLTQLSPAMEHDEHHHERMTSATGQEATEDNPASGATDQAELPSPNTEERGISRLPAPTREVDPIPDSIGRETCPICIVDFGEGDDLRVLPCEGKHRFHQSCVDPWLLELSASCPICRQDFRALETIISGESGGAGPANRNSEASTPTTPNRFSRYLRFARRHQQSGDREWPLPPGM